LYRKRHFFASALQLAQQEPAVAEDLLFEIAEGMLND
jgi:hypothetical protein